MCLFSTKISNTTVKYFFTAFLILISSLFLQAQKTDKAFKAILKKNKKLSGVLSNPTEYGVQILYTSIKNGKPSKTLAYNLSDKNYFYPASTIKLPSVLLALEKLNRMGAAAGIDQNTPMRINSNLENYPSAIYDSTSQNFYPSIAHYAKKILLVSDNDAYNRLFDFVGPKAFNQSMREKAYKDFRAAHRLEISLSPEVNRSKPEVSFGPIKLIPSTPAYANTDRMEVSAAETFYNEPARVNEAPEYKATKPILIGKGYKSNGELVNKPMDFSAKNVFTLTEQHDMLMALFFPKEVPSSRRFDLSNEQLDFVKKYMSMLPRESDFPKYDESEYFDSYVKFFMFGDQKDRMPEDIKIYNKVGEAYGFLIDNAYIVDSKSGVEFILSAVIYCNKDGILNDNNYDYDEIGFPFLAELGRAIYNYELKKK